MGTISTSVGLDRISRVSGYTVRGRFNNDTQNLPQVITFLRSCTNQSGLTATKRVVTSALNLEICMVMVLQFTHYRILRPLSGMVLVVFNYFLITIVVQLLQQGFDCCWNCDCKCYSYSCCEWKNKFGFSRIFI